MKLEKNFIEYKEITLTIFEAVKTGEYEKLEKMFQQRQLILNDIDKNDYSKEKMNKLYLKYELENEYKVLASEMKIKKYDLLKKIEKNKKRQIAVAGYNNISSKAVFLSKEV